MVECWGKQSTYNHEEIHSFLVKETIIFTPIKSMWNG